MKKVVENYGIDAPGVVRTLFGAGTALVQCGGVCGLLILQGPQAATVRSLRDNGLVVGGCPLGWLLDADLERLAQGPGHAEAAERACLDFRGRHETRCSAKLRPIMTIKCRSGACRLAGQSPRSFLPAAGERQGLSPGPMPF